MNLVGVHSPPPPMLPCPGPASGRASTRRRGETRHDRGWQQLLYKSEDRVATITLNRPDRLNAYTAVMSGELREAFAQADAERQACGRSSPRAGKGFCAGADMALL